MRPEDPPEPADSIARAVAKELIGEGAAAVVLSGSHARGEAGPESDLDLYAVGPREYACRLERRGGVLVSVSSKSLQAYRRALDDPGAVCRAVPGWREALPILDPGGLAAGLIRDAHGWRWGPLEERCDRWVAEEITALAEEALKLLTALRAEDRAGAGAQRSLLALHLAPVLAVHRRLLYGSENGLWELLSAEMGEGWRRAQGSAFGLGDEPFEETCRAALRLYALAVGEADPLFDERQAGVAEHARRLVDRVP